MGRAVHAVIQSVPLDPQPGVLDAFVSAQSVAEAVPDREDDVRRLAARALASGAIERAGRADRALREVPFGYEAPGGTIVERFIDLVIDGDEGLEIVDWKTDGITESEVEDRLDQYRLQAGLFVLGLQHATGREVAKVTYVFLAPGIERELADPAELAALAEDAIVQDRAPVA